MNPRKILTLFFTILSIVGYGLIAFSAGPFAPGTELDPGCSPYINNDPNQGVDTDCVVEQLIATTATSYTWVGSNAGQNGGSTDNTVFIGIGAGDGATNANNSNFIGTGAGENALNAYNSNFFGPNAGCNAINANDSNFFGFEAGCFAINADNSNFFGNRAGYYAADAQRSTFFGDKSGYEAANAEQSNFTGYEAGYQATNAYNANFSGYRAGYGASEAFNSNFFGIEAGYGSVAASSSNFFGSQAGKNAPYASGSVFIGTVAGQNASDAYVLGGLLDVNVFGAHDAVFIGSSAGENASRAAYANFIGVSAGKNNTNGLTSNFVGYGAGENSDSLASNYVGFEAGKNATSEGANFFGNQSGYGTVNVDYASFYGHQTGYQATNAVESSFFGEAAGMLAVDASGSVFLGSAAGSQSATAANAIFIGNDAGLLDTVDNTTAFDDISTFANTSILIGRATSTGGFSNSIALGAYAENTTSNQFMIGSSTRRIEEMVFNGGSGNTCSIVAGTGISCSSDERLKTNITDLDDTTLDKLLNIQTVTYNWKEGINQNTQIGFIAQNINEYFPELVSVNNDGMFAVNYAGMTPILTKAIQELDMKIDAIETIASLPTNDSLREIVRSILEDIQTGIVRIFTRELCLTEEGYPEECITRSQLKELKTLLSTPNQDAESVDLGDEVLPEPETDSLINSEIVPEDVPEPEIVSESDSVSEPETVLDSMNQNETSE